MGTTVATNALLERKGEPHGARDHARLSRRAAHRLPEPAEAVRPADRAARAALRARDRGRRADRRARRGRRSRSTRRRSCARAAGAFDDGIRAVAIVLMHGYRYPEHERARRARARIGFTQVSVSHEVSPLMKLVSRGDTTVVDAYLSPILRRYVDAGGGADRGARQGVRAPVHAVVRRADRRASVPGQGRDPVRPGGRHRRRVRAGARSPAFAKIIGFDMGGTSTDVSHFAGEYERAFETEVAGRAAARADDAHPHGRRRRRLDLHFDGARLRVGPESAGANPGPACYRRGGPLTVTDCNVMLGKLSRSSSRACSARAATSRSTRDRAREVRGARRRDGGGDRASDARPRQSPTASSASRSRTWRTRSSRSRCSAATTSPSTRCCCFGGAGGQHACLVADALGMTRVFIHPLAGVLSAYGMGLADVRAMRQQAVEASCSRGGSPMSSRRSTRSAPRRARSRKQGVRRRASARRARASEVRGHRHARSRFLPAARSARDRAAFERRYRQPLRLPDARQAAGGRGDRRRGDRRGGATRARRPRRGAALARPARLEPSAQSLYTDGGWSDDALVYSIARTLRPGDTIAGPAIIARAQRDDRGRARLARDADRARSSGARARRSRARARTRSAPTADPVLLEVFNNLFMSIAEQMGVTLANTAYSVNIKERLDFSCALFDARGQPDRERAAHAGAPRLDGRVVKTVIDAARRHDAAGRRVRAERAVQRRHAPAGRHRDHAGVPRPPRAGAVLRRLARPSRRHRRHHAGLDAAGQHAQSTRRACCSTTCSWSRRGASSRRGDARPLVADAIPARNVEQNLADLRAQVAANEKGAQELREDGRAFRPARSCAPTCATCRTTPRSGAPRDRRADGRRVRSAEMDNGAHIRVRDHASTASARGDDRLHRHQRAAAEQLQRAVGGLQGGGALRVPHAGRRRDPDERRLPEAARRSIIPEGSMLAPRYPAAVVAGNVETSQAITDCALRRARRARGGAGHDEQLHVRQRPPTSTTRRSRGGSGAGRTSTARASCRRT